MNDNNLDNGGTNEIYAFPTSYAQQRLWFLHQLEPDGHAYNIPAAFRLSGPVNATALEKSVQELVRRHEILRTTFSLLDGEPKQIVAPAAPAAMSIVDLRSLRKSEREDELRRRVTKETKRSFDLEKGPLFQVSLVLIGDEESVLIITMHHVISDGWSMPILFREIAICYEAFSKNMPPVLPELPIQYADYAIWQRERLRGDFLEEQVSYWKKQLAGITGVLNLPTDKPRPSRQSFRGRSQSLEFSRELTDGLRALSQKQGVTLFMTLLAAFQTLLYRYTGQEDIVVGSPIANRTRTEVEGLIGFFVNTLVLRANFAGNPSFRELLGRVRDTALGAYEHQDLPFEKLVEELQPERSLSYSPLFQVMFILQNAPSASIELQELSMSPIRAGTDTAKFDLTLSMHEQAGGLRASLQYNTDLFNDATVARMRGHLAILLEGIVRKPEQRISDLPILTQAERYQLLFEWNDTKRDYPKDKCIHQLFEAQVEKTPDAAAVVFENQQLTYADLNRRANQLAHYLQTLGVGPEMLVGICMEQSLEMVVGLLGILKAGGAYVPFDPRYPKERLRFMLQDTQTTVLITQQRLIENLPEHHAQLVCLDRDLESIIKCNGENPVSGVTTENTAFVIYTSGSTGNPKGVLAPHRGAVNRLDWMWLAYPFGPREVLCQKTSLNFVDSVCEIFGPLLKGIPLAIISKKHILDPNRLIEVLAKYCVTRIVIVPSLLRTLLNVFPDLNSKLPDLRYWFVSGEALAVDLAQLFREVMPGCILVNLYGSSEVAADVTVCEISNARLPPVSIGRPIGNTQVYLLDNQLQPVPINVTGQIYVGGDGLAHGYWNRPELTAEKFIPNPFSSSPEGRLYQTGDLARYLPNGHIEFLGRADKQVKIRGFRIEPAEIESVLCQHSNISEAVVIAAKNSVESHLVAYVVSRQNPPQPTSLLRSFLQNKLPDYMVPAAIVFLESLPLTPNGKVDYRALPEPSSEHTTKPNQYVAPHDETEKALCRVWSEVLKVDRVGIDDDFFSIGGHSLLAAKLFARLDELFGHTLPLGVLFAAPTVRALAEHYRAKNSSGVGVLVAVQALGTLPPLFAVPGLYGNVLGYADLSRALGPNQPFYGLQSIGLDGAEPPIEYIDEMARRYINEIVLAQPHGPYTLIGACFGATLAYEVARQLLETGEEVAFLGLLDPTHHEGYELNDNGISMPNVIKRAKVMATFIRGRLRLYRVEMKPLDSINRIKFLTKKFWSASSLFVNRNSYRGIRLEFHQLAIVKANIRALERYNRKPLRGRLRFVEIFESSHPRNSSHWNFDWKKMWEGQLRRHPLPGKDSGDMASGNNARVLARLLSERLQEAFGHSSEESDARK